MSQIFRGITERFNPQVHTEEKSLTVNMNKSFAVKEKTFDLFAIKNKFVSFLYATGRVNMGVGAGKVMKPRASISDNAYRVQYNGSLFIPAYATGDVTFGDVVASGNMPTGVVYGTGVAAAADIVHDVKAAFAVKHIPTSNIFGDKFNEGDVIALNAYKGAQFIVVGTPYKAPAGTHYVVNTKCTTATGLFDADHVADGELLPEAGNRFGEGSTRGYQRERRTKWRINYSFITRASLTLTGSALTQKKVVWIENQSTGAKMWEWEAVMDLRERHAINLELGARYARTTMDASSHAWYEDYGTNKMTLDGFTADYGIVAPVVGDGWIAQLDDAFTITYDPNAAFPVGLLELFMTVLSQRSPSGTTGNVFIGLGDKLSHIKIDEAFKGLIGWTVGSNEIKHNTSVVQNVRTGKDNSIGFKITKYYYLDNEFIFIEDELMNNPAFAPQNGGIIGTGDIYVLNASMVDGVSNIDLLARRDRDLRAKYINGLHSLDSKQNNSSYAASGFDGGRYDLLSEILPLIYSTESCGRILASAKFTGGAMSALPIASEQATTWHF